MARFEAMNTLDTELNAAVETALNKHGEKVMQKLFAPPVAAERISKFVADRTKPRLVRLVFSSLIYKHSAERSIVRVVGIFFVADISSYQHSDLVTNIVYNAF